MPRGKKPTIYLPVPIRATARALVVPDDKAEEAKAAQAAYAQMNDKLKKATQNVFSMLLNIAQEGIKRMWKLGEFVRKIRDNEETYGDDAIYLLEKVVGKSSKSTIQKAIMLNTWFNETQLEKMLGLKMKLTGKPLSWQHYEKLLTIKDKDQRDEVLKMTVERELTPEEVQKLALHARGENRPHGGGRPVAIPATYMAKSIHYLKKFNAILRDADAIYDNAEQGFFECAESMPADKITPEMIEKTHEMAEVTNSVLDFTRQFTLRLLDTVEVLQKRMNAQAAQQGVNEVEAMTEEPDAADESNIIEAEIVGTEVKPKAVTLAPY